MQIFRETQTIAKVEEILYVCKIMETVCCVFEILIPTPLY